MIQHKSTLNSRENLMSALIANKNADCYITSVAKDESPIRSNLPSNVIAVVEYYNVDWSEPLIKLLGYV